MNKSNLNICCEKILESYKIKFCTNFMLCNIIDNTLSKHIQEYLECKNDVEKTAHYKYIQKRITLILNDLIEYYCKLFDAPSSLEKHEFMLDFLQYRDIKYFVENYRKNLDKLNKDVTKLDSNIKNIYKNNINKLNDYIYAKAFTIVAGSTACCSLIASIGYRFYKKALTSLSIILFSNFAIFSGVCYDKYCNARHIRSNFIKKVEKLSYKKVLNSIYS